jgi:tetraacyldisaccharide 4'-kinase
MQLLLFPLAVIYHFITSVRNFLYDKNVLKSFQFKSIKTICVGNLAVGGTGKTPMIQYLIEKYQNNYQIATLSRGYKRTTKGFLIASEENEVYHIGDEPMQIFRRYPQITVTVGEDRVNAVQQLLKVKNDTNLILLDDAFQHRKIEADLNIVLTSYDNRFYKDFLLPFGTLRESRNGISRADVVVVTKCPADLSEKKRKKAEKKIMSYVSDNTEIFFSYIQYAKPQPVYFNNSGIEVSKDILLFSGIANPQPFIGYISQNYTIKKTIKYPDHHHYTEKDALTIIEEFNKIDSTHKTIFTTEKDMVKLHKMEIFNLLKDLPIYFIPMEMKFIEREIDFEKCINKKLNG